MDPYFPQKDAATGNTLVSVAPAPAAYGRKNATAEPPHPFSCTQMSEEKRLDIEAGLFSEKCQHLHPELAPIREGDKEPAPCCLNCEHKTCFSRCDVAKKKDEDERKKEQAELQKRQKEAEGKKPDMMEKEIESLYGWRGIKPEDKITGAWLKDQQIIPRRRLRRRLL